MQSNYNAGKELIEWLNSEEVACTNVPIMIFCGRGSVSYVQETKEKYKVRTSGEVTALYWCRAGGGACCGGEDVEKNL